MAAPNNCDCGFRPLKVGDEFDLDIIPESDGYEVVHNHFDCPICKKEYSSTNIYGPLYEEKFPFIIECENCESEFESLEQLYWDGFWKLIKLGDKHVTRNLPT